MKNRIKNTITFLFVSGLALTGCLDLSQNASDADASLKKTMQVSPIIETPFVSCQYQNRQPTVAIVKKTGIIVQMSSPGDPETPTYIIQIPDAPLRYVPCSLPESAQVNGAKITFSGNAVEIFPEEHWIATPLNLTNVFSIELPDGVSSNPTVLKFTNH